MKLIQTNGCMCMFPNCMSIKVVKRKKKTNKKLTKKIRGALKFNENPFHTFRNNLPKLTRC